MMESILPGVADWLAQWSSMGGYAAFVWPAYAVACVVLGGLAWHSWRAHRVSEAALARLQLRADNASGRNR
jgi:heme exporter protein D